MSAELSRPGFEDARVGAATLGAAALVAQQVIGKALRDTLFLGAFGIGKLPYAMIASALLSGTLVVAVSRAAAARSPRAIARVAPLLSAALFLLAWGLSGPSPRAAAAVTYLHAGALSAASVSIFWSLVSESFDPYAARASVPRIMAGATLGGVVGGLVTWRAASWVAPADLLPAGAVLNLVVLAAVSRVGRGAPRDHASEADVTGWRSFLRDVPYLRSVALLVLAGAATQAVLEFLLSSAAVSALGTGPRLLSFLALFQTAVGVLSFLMQVGVSRSVLERFGVGWVLAASPSLLLVGAVAASFAPPLVAAVLLRGTDGVLGASLHRSAYEVLFAPVEPQRKRASKPLLDVGFDRAGLLLGSAAVALVVAVAPASSRTVLLALVAALALVRLLLSPRLQAGYRGSLAENLQGGRLWRSGVGVLDRGTVGALSRSSARRSGSSRAGEVAALQGEVAALHGGDARARDADGGRLSIVAFDLPAWSDAGPADDEALTALAELRSGDPERELAILRQRRTEPLLAPQVLALLADDRVARDAADWLTAQDPAPVGLLGDALLAGRLPDPARRRIARLLGKLDDARAVESLLAALPVVPTGVRPALASALARSAARRRLPREPLFAALRRVATEPSRGDAVLEEIFLLLAAAYPREPVSRAREALDRGGDARGTALEWLDVVLPHDVKTVLWPRIARSGERVTSKPRTAEELRSALQSTALGGAPASDLDPDR